MTPERLKLAVHLHFTMDMDADHAGCPFSDEDSAKVAADQLESTADHWSEFKKLMAEVGEPIPEDFHWNDHTDLLT